MKALAPVRIEPLQTLAETGAQLTLDVDGTVVPFQESRVAAEVAGRVTFKSKDCEAGQYVKKGDLLMKIDPTDHKIEVERLTRQKEQEYQSLREIDQEMINAKRLIVVANADVKLQKKEVDRQKAMPKGYASRTDIDKANRSLLAATQQLVNSQNQLSLLKKRRVRLEASEKLADTRLRLAEINLERAEIRAPIDGVIVSEEVDLNTFVSRGTTLMVIENTSKAEVASSLRMDQLHWVLNQTLEGQTPKGQASQGYNLPETPAIIEYEMSGRENVVYRWKGRLVRYHGIGLDRETRTAAVRILVDHPRRMVDAMGQPDTTVSPRAVGARHVYSRSIADPTHDALDRDPSKSDPTGQSCLSVFTRRIRARSRTESLHPPSGFGRTGPASDRGSGRRGFAQSGHRSNRNPKNVRP